MINCSVHVWVALGYEEDFEADDEDPMNDGVDEGNKTSLSLCREEEEERRKDENGNEDLNSNSQCFFLIFIYGNRTNLWISLLCSILIFSLKFCSPLICYPSEVRGSSSISSSLSCSEEDELEEEQENEELNPNKHTATLSSIKDAEENEVLQTNSVSLLTKDESPNQEMEHGEYGEAEQPKDKPRKSEECTDDAGEAKEPRNECGEAEEPRGESGKNEEPGEAQKAREDIRERRADVNKERNQGEY